MKRKLLSLFFIALVMGGLYVLATLSFDNIVLGTLTVADGKADLSHWNFAQRGVATLNGEWDFYPGQLLSPADVLRQKGSTAVPTMLLVPGSWSGKMDSLGVATYRLRVKVSNNHAIYGMIMPSVQMSSRVFVNGAMVGSSGNPAKGSSYRGKNDPYVTFLTLHPGFNEILLQVANFDLPSSSGIRQPIYFGYANQIVSLGRKALEYDYVNVTVFMVMGLYFWGWYYQRRRDTSVLLFGLLCVCLGIFTAFTGQKVMYAIFPNFPYWLILRVQTGTATAAGTVLLLYVYNAFRVYCMKRLVWIGVVVGAIIFLLELSPAQMMYTHVGGLATGAYVFFTLCYSVSVLVVGVLDRAEGSIYMAVAAIALSVYSLINNLYLYFHVPLYTFPPVFSFTFILMLALRKSLRFSNTFTENQLLSTRLIQADKMKDGFLSKTAHEFKTPLHGMISIAQSMLDDVKAPLTLPQRENVGMISTAAKRLSQLVYDILDFVRLREGQLKVSLGPLDVRSAVEALLRVYEFIIPEKSVNLVNNVPENLPLALADESRFRQVCINLLDNAIKHSKAAVIEVTAVVTGKTIEVSVVDTGTGIDEDELARIFEPFTSLHPDSEQSFGIGLSIVKQLVELQNGRVWVSSTKGQGSRFAFSLPMAGLEHVSLGDGVFEPSANHFTSPGIPERSFPLPYISAQEGTHTILIVDDRYSNLYVLITLLEKLNYTVIAVNQGQDALSYLEKGSGIDMVILDLMMPGISGLEVCQMVREKYSLLELPVVMITASIQTEDKIAAFAAGANDYLPKPFDEAELKARIHSLLVMRDSATKAMRMEVAFLQSQIKPHFLFNVLNTMMALSYTDAERARKLTADLSDYLRGSFSFGNEQSKVLFENELSLIRSYVEIEKARFKDRIQVEYDFVPSAFDVMIPPLIIQPLVENAIRHGIGNCVEGGTVFVRAYEREAYIVFEIEDNGAGMSNERLLEILTMDWKAEIGQRRGVGLQNINRRLMYWYGTELAIESTLGIGTKVTLAILPDSSLVRAMATGSQLGVR